VRQALNENPVVQAVIVGLLVIAVAFLLLTRVVGGGGSDEAVPAPGAEAAVTAGISSEVGADEVDGVVDAVRGAVEAGDAKGAFDAISTAAAGGFKPGPGLPAKVVDAYRDGKAIAVLITRAQGIEDKRLRQMQSRIRSAGNVAVFHAYARDIARYSRITGGVDVSRVPALVVIRPRKHSLSGVPVASVSYGFRGPASAEQAVRDALYEGRSDIPYHPYPEPKKQKKNKKSR
jgi:hypothetical protein